MLSRMCGSTAGADTKSSLRDLKPLNGLSDRELGDDEIALLFLARGSGIAKSTGREWPLVRGSVCVARQRLQVTGPILRGWVLTLCCREVADSSASAQILGTRQLLPGVASRCEGFFEALEIELDRGAGDESPSATQSLIDLIMLCHDRAPHADEDLGEVAYRSSRAQLVADEIQVVIDRRFAERLSLADIAAELNRSASSLTRAARAVTGQSVLELITEKRIREARHLLTATDLPVGEIAGLVGYTNAGHFHRAFRRSTSMTPRGWRASASRALASRAT